MVIFPGDVLLIEHSTCDPDIHSTLALTWPNAQLAKSDGRNPSPDIVTILTEPVTKFDGYADLTETGVEKRNGTELLV